MRKRLHVAVTALFGPGLAHVGNLSADYEGELAGSKVLLGLDLGGSYWQLGYQVSVACTDPPGRLARVGFETALGIGRGHWDFITSDNLDEAITLLCKSVRYVAELPRLLPVGCLEVDG